MTMRAIMNEKVVRFSVMALLVLSLGAACASETTTVKRETVQYSVPSVEGTQEKDAQEKGTPGPVVEKQTTETTTETRQESDGVLSSGINFIGNVIAFPFRVIGAVLGLLF